MDESKKKKNSDELENEDIIEVDDISDEDSFSLDDDFGIDGGNQKSQDAKSDYKTVGEEGVEDLIYISPEEQEEALVEELATNEKIIKEHSPDDTSMDKIEETPEDAIDAPFETSDTTDPVQLDEDEINVIDAEVEKAKNEPKTQSHTSSASQGSASSASPSSASPDFQDSPSADADQQSVDANEKKETKKRKTKSVKKTSGSKESKKSSKKSSNTKKKENVKYILSPKKIIKNEKTAALIAYLDELLCHLPKKRIEQFARSEHFSTYEEIMEKIQKSPE